MSASNPASSILERLALVPDGVDVALLLRHAERGEIPTGTFGADVPLTARGVASAERLGAQISERRSRVRTVSSPLPRCVQTAEALMHGGGWTDEVSRARACAVPVLS